MRSRRASSTTPVALVALAALLVLMTGGCGDSGDTTGPTDADSPVAGLELVGGADQRLLAGRRSPEPLRVRATDAAGDPVVGEVVRFSLDDPGMALLSQPRALTDAVGVAETFLLDSRSGPVVVTATAGSATLDVPLEVERTPGELRFTPGTGEAGLPGHPHPDSVVAVQVLDTEGEPLPGTEVWFAGHRRLSTVRDTSDADGMVSTVIREGDLRAGEGRLFAFVLDFPELTESTSRPIVAAARRVVLVSVDGLRADAIERWGPPALSAMAAEGGFTDGARTVEPSLTTPAHLSMLAGVGPESHGVYSEDLTFTAEMTELEPLFLFADERGLRARAFMARDGPLSQFEVVLECRVAFGIESLTLVDAPAQAISAAAAPTLDDPEIRLVLLHIPDPSDAGVTHGFGSEEYGEAVMRADEAMAAVADRLGPDDLLIVTSDHGGGGAYGSHQHGSTSDEDMLIPILLSGSRVVPTDLGDASILDVAPTVLWALGFRPPNQYEGEALLESFR